MSYRIASALLFLLFFCSVSSAQTVRIADGDCTSLSAAAAAAPGNEPSLVVLAANGSYGNCRIAVHGNISIDGAGATMRLSAPTQPINDLSVQITVDAGASLRIRNLDFDGAAGSAARAAVASATTTPKIIFGSGPAIANGGKLVLEAISLSDVSSTGVPASPLIASSGSLVLRNATLVGNAGPSLLSASAGSVEISQSTFTANSVAAVLDAATGASIRVSNSLFANPGPTCSSSAADSPRALPDSAGGNVTSDDSCVFRALGDRVVVDAKLGTFGDNGGLVNTVLLRGDSPAVHDGLSANCEASDARGIVRNVAARGGCDAGAYEFGGGRGLLSEGGMNGFFYDAAADGHYVTVQRLDWGSALVIWNTFDRNGNAAWIYSIGSVDGNHIHAQSAQNLGGVLQPGGAPTGSHGFVWGDIDIDFADCFNATFRYASSLPNFGSGQFPLNRLAFLGDIDCSH